MYKGVGVPVRFDDLIFIGHLKTGGGEGGSSEKRGSSESPLDLPLNILGSDFSLT